MPRTQKFELVYSLSSDNTRSLSHSLSSYYASDEQSYTKQTEAPVIDLFTYSNALCDCDVNATKYCIP